MYKFSQSALKSLEDPTTCPTKWRAVWVDKQWERQPTLAMLKGSYFEQLWLGMGAKDEQVIDLPRLKNGNKSKDQLRIEEQAIRAKELFDPTHKDFLGFTINAVQVKLSDENSEGTADIWATDREGESWLIDAKLTGDLTSTFGPYAWGRPWEELDLVQLPHYQDLFLKQYGHRPRMALFVADYSPAKRISFDELVISDERRKTKNARFSAARKIFEEYSLEGFPVEPSEKECKDCKLDCKFRYNETK